MVKNLIREKIKTKELSRCQLGEILRTPRQSEEGIHFVKNKWV